MNIQHVRTFLALVEAGSFVGAAARLGVSQPTVSQQVRKLEAAFGKVLVRRSHAACTPTPHGRAILPYARALVAAAERLEEAGRGDAVLVGCSGNIVSYFISDELHRFAGAIGEPFRWRLRAATNPELSEAVAAGEVDVAAMEWPDRRAGLEVLPWRTEPMCVIVAPDHPLAGRGEITVDELAGLDLLGGERGSGTGTVLSEALGERASELRITHSLPTTEAVKSAVRAGLGASVVLEAAVGTEAAAGALSVLSVAGVRLEKTFHVAVPEGLPEEALPARFARFLAHGALPESDAPGAGEATAEAAEAAAAVAPFEEAEERR